MTTQEQGLTLTRKVFDPVASHFTPGERSMVAWLTMDCVDHEKDVVVSSGIDYKTYFQSNPVVLAVHDFGRWPLGKCAWIQAKKNEGFNGLYAKTILDSDEEAEKVWGKIKSGSLKGISIGFRPPDDLRPGEWGPPTREELARRPDWKGAERVIRRCVLLEYSVCSLPMNPRALVDAVNKGVHRPVYNLAKGAAMDEETPEVEPEDKAACDCGEAKCEECSERLRRKAEDDDADEGDDEAPEAKAMDEAETESTEAEEDLDDEAEEEEGAGFKRGDHVKVKSPVYKGVGVVQGVHRRGIVPHANNDLMASKDEPAARVKCYKAMGDGHTPTDFHVAVKCAHMSKMDEPMKPPSKGKRASWDTATKTDDSPIGESTGPLPPLVCLSDTEIAQKALKEIAAIPNQIEEYLYKLVGGV